MLRDSSAHYLLKEIEALTSLIILIYLLKNTLPLQHLPNLKPFPHIMKLKNMNYNLIFYFTVLKLHPNMVLESTK